jgi:hypothetical protein
LGTFYYTIAVHNKARWKYCEQRQYPPLKICTRGQHSTFMDIAQYATIQKQFSSVQFISIIYCSVCLNATALLPTEMMKSVLLGLLCLQLIAVAVSDSLYLAERFAYYSAKLHNTSNEPYSPNAYSSCDYVDVCESDLTKIAWTVSRSSTRACVCSAAGSDQCSVVQWRYSTHSNFVVPHVYLHRTTPISFPLSK